MMPGATPPDMECDVVEEVASTSQHQPLLASTSNTNKQTDTTKAAKSTSKANERKRQRLENALSPINIAASDLSERLSSHNPNDQNKYGILGVLADIDIECTPPPSKQQAQVPLNKEVNITKPKTKWCPPILVFNVNIKTLVDTLKVTIPEFSFKINNINKNKSKLYFEDSTVHASMMALLRDKNIHSYTFTPKDQRQISLVLRGLYPESDIEEIKTEMNKIIADTVANVSKFKTPGSIKKGVDTGLFLISLLPGKTAGDVSHIHGLQNQIISWEKPKRKEGDIQCRRCQRWGHISRNCDSAYKCVKCDQNHAPGECQRIRLNDTDPYCTNCNEVGHPANWRGCPTYKKYVAARQQKIDKAREEKAIAKNNVHRAVGGMSMVSSGQTFANLFQPHSNPPNTRQQKPSIIDEFSKLANNFLEPEELSLEQEISLFLANYTTMSNSEGKTEFLHV